MYLFLILFSSLLDCRPKNIVHMCDWISEMNLNFISEICSKIEIYERKYLSAKVNGLFFFVRIRRKYSLHTRIIHSISDIAASMISITQSHVNDSIGIFASIRSDKKGKYFANSRISKWRCNGFLSSLVAENSPPIREGSVSLSGAKHCWCLWLLSTFYSYFLTEHLLSAFIGIPMKTTAKI